MAAGLALARATSNGGAALSFEEARIVAQMILNATEQ
jgi:hypothetical protein